MTARTISICKFVGTISLGILTGVSATLSTQALPALLALPTAVNAHDSLTYLSTKSHNLTSYLRHISTFTLFSAYLLAPRRLRHPYLLYTSILAFASGAGVDFAMSWTEPKPVAGTTAEVGGGAGAGAGETEGAEKSEEVNGEQVRQAVERKQFAERVKAGLAGVAFAMQVVGIWGDGA